MSIRALYYFIVENVGWLLSPPVLRYPARLRMSRSITLEVFSSLTSALRVSRREGYRAWGSELMNRCQQAAGWRVQSVAVRRKLVAFGAAARWEASVHPPLLPASCNWGGVWRCVIAVDEGERHLGKLLLKGRLGAWRG
jgi:hypothetical protein